MFLVVELNRTQPSPSSEYELPKRGARMNDDACKSNVNNEQNLLEEK